ncbi:MAG: hypothetical protein HND57_07500 [Planctomycetes bacterium]|nr:hypothetical protein [Planctomycetota bacterium]
MAYPRLRAVEAHPIEHEGQEMVALRDVSNLTDQVCVMSRSALAVCARFTGESSIAEIAASFQVEEKTILEMARSLDEALMLEGETLEAHARSLTTAFDALEALPIRAAADVTPQAMNEAIHAHDMSGDRTRFMTLSGLVAPHLDFERGRLNYAAAYAHLGDPPEDSAPEPRDRIGHKSLRIRDGRRDVPDRIRDDGGCGAS